MVWASITEIDNVTRGSGKTISEAKNQFVQSSEPGVLKKRYFSDGDRISKGDILLISTDRGEVSIGSISETFRFRN